MNSNENIGISGIERQNLLKIAEYAIKELVNISVEDTNIIDGDSFYVNQILAVFDQIFLHGLKFSNRQIWKMIMEWSKDNKDYQDTINNVTHLPNVKSNLGCLRAWIRLMLMQKMFGDFFSKIIENKNFLSHYYTNTAFLVNEEAQILGGLLLSLNFLDFNFCLKETNLDDIKICVDVGRFMKIASLETPLNMLENLNSNYINNSFDQDSISVDSSKESRITDILDQKNYLEEINRTNNNHINELKHKFNSCKQECEMLKRELAHITRKNIELETANSLLIANFEKPKYSDKLPVGTVDVTKCFTATNIDPTSHRVVETQNDTKMLDPVKDNENTLQVKEKECIEMKCLLDQLKQDMLEEKANRLKFEHQYQVANKRKNELEGMYKTLEKLDKQKSDHNIDMKRQIDDFKAINAEMYTKIENYESSLQHKNELVNRLEQKNRSQTSAYKELEEKYDKLQSYQSSTEDIFGKMEREINKKDQIQKQLENDLKIERELKISLQHQMQKDKLEFARKLKEISRAEDILKNNEYLHKRNEELLQKCQDQEQSLFELGLKLEKATLHTDDLKDAFMPYIIDSKWQKDDEVSDCPICHIIFSTVVRKHHCRNCGGIFCQDCSKYRGNMSFSSKPVRVCLQCYNLLLNKPQTTDSVAVQLLK